MKLIDVDRLHTDITTQIEDCADVLEIIERQPFFEARKTGEWIDTGSGQQCSVCGEVQYGYDNYRAYCAACGAAMRGKT